MKKGLIVAFGLMTVVLLSGCGNKEVETPNENVPVDNSYENVSLTLDELDSLEESLFPVAYTYTTYQKEDWSISDSWEYTYLPDDKYLIPIEEELASRELSTSEVKNGMVYSMVDAKLADDSMVSILYINEPGTLKYYFATVYGETETTLYTFTY